MNKYLFSNIVKISCKIPIIKIVRFDLSKNQERYADTYDRSKIKRTPLYLQMKEIELDPIFVEKIRKKIHKLGTLTFSELMEKFKEEYETHELEIIAAIKIVAKMKTIDGKRVLVPKKN